ncbi:hypothetical protein KKA66_00780 [Patescibacteria group bacterium]|nr:hypothetical protein [Patescibacteria group bacterium]
MNLPIHPDKLPKEMKIKDFVETIRNTADLSKENFLKQHKGTKLTQRYSYGSLTKKEMTFFLEQMKEKDIKLSEKKLKRNFEKYQETQIQKSKEPTAKPSGPGFLKRIFKKPQAQPSSKFYNLSRERQNLSQNNLPSQTQIQNPTQNLQKSNLQPMPKGMRELLNK